jgi:hypothetical protein
LPYTFSKTDYFIRPQFEDAADGIARLIKNGKKIIFVYNYRIKHEYVINPEKLLFITRKRKLPIQVRILIAV